MKTRNFQLAPPNGLTSISVAWGSKTRSSASFLRTQPRDDVYIFRLTMRDLFNGRESGNGIRTWYSWEPFRSACFFFFHRVYHVYPTCHPKNGGPPRWKSVIKCVSINISTSETLTSEYSWKNAMGFANSPRVRRQAVCAVNEKLRESSLPRLPDLSLQDIIM